MTALRIAVLGGGPAGLTAARVLKRQQPTWAVTLFERQAPERTYGYGVGLGWGALKRLQAADADLVSALERATVGVDTWTIRRGGESISAYNSHGLGIARAELLSILAQHAVAAGVDVRGGTDMSAGDLDGFDVVIAADGVGSQTRQALAAELGASVSHGELAYLWAGAALSLDAMTLALVQTPAGPLAAHVMPYAAGLATFQVDARQSVFQNWPLTAAGAPTDPLAMLEEAFADLLQGSRLQAKRPQWQTFATVTCERWSHGKVVLAGDAVHTAHYSVGSGTGLAVEDGVELAECLSGSASVPEAFAAYEQARKPRVAKLQARADRSQRWWTSLDLRIDVPLPQLLLSYLTRTGAVTLAMAHETNQELIGQCLPAGVTEPAELADQSSRRWADSQHREAQTHTVHLVGGASSVAADQLVEEVLDLTARGVTRVRVLGPGDRDAVLDRLEFAERLGAQTKVRTAVAGTAETRDTLLLGLLTGHTHHLEIS